jgi:hypothetical protein
MFDTIGGDSGVGFDSSCMHADSLTFRTDRGDTHPFGCSIEQMRSACVSVWFMVMGMLRVLVVGLWMLWGCWFDFGRDRSS